MVGDNKAAFESSLTNQLSSILRTDTANIRNMRIWPGSVEVDDGLSKILYVASSCPSGCLQSGGPHRAGRREEGAGISRNSKVRIT